MNPLPPKIRMHLRRLPDSTSILVPFSWNSRFWILKNKFFKTNTVYHDTTAQCRGRKNMQDKRRRLENNEVDIRTHLPRLTRRSSDRKLPALKWKRFSFLAIMIQLVDLNLFLGLKDWAASPSTNFWQNWNFTVTAVMSSSFWSRVKLEILEITF